MPIGAAQPRPMPGPPVMTVASAFTLADEKVWPGITSCRGERQRASATQPSFPSLAGLVLRGVEAEFLPEVGEADRVHGPAVPQQLPQRRQARRGEHGPE